MYVTIRLTLPAILLFLFMLTGTARAEIYVDKELSIVPQRLQSTSGTLQLLTHGKPGYLWINNEWMNAQQVALFLRPYLKDIRQLNIYGCEFGKGAKGENAVAYLQKKLAIPVAASDNITGADGDWVLEVGQVADAISIPGFEGNLQSGTSTSPYTSLLQAACNTTAGVKYFNLSGTTFSTYVDASGNVLVAYDSTNNITLAALTQTTALTGTSKGILSSAVLAKFTDTKQIKITSGDGKVDARTTDNANISRLVAFSVINQGTTTATSNATWIQMGSDPAITFTGATCASPFSSNLAEAIIHPCGNTGAFHWVAKANSRYEVFGTIVTPATSFAMWVNGISPPTNSSTSTTICAGSSTTLSATCSGDTVEWYTNIAGTGTPLYNSAMVSPVTTTSYYPFCRISGCRGPVGKPDTVVVNAKPTITGDSTVCLSGGSTLTLTGSASAGTAPSWTSGSTSIATVVSTSSTTTTVTPVAIGTTTITYKNTNGCTNTKNITVTEPSITGSTSVCAGSSVTYTGSGTPATSTPWASSSTATATISSSGVLTAIAAGTTNITYTNSNGCKKTIAVTVNAKPATPTGISNSTICKDDSANLSGSAACASGNTLTWYSDATLNTVTGNMQSPAATTNFYGACVNNTTGCKSNSVTKVVIVNPRPTFTVASTQVSCNGGSNGALAITAASGTAPYTYSDNNGSSYQSSNSFTGLAAGSYTVVVKDANTCTSLPSTTTISQPAVLSQTSTTSNVTCNGGTNGSIVVTASGGTTPYTYSNNGGTSYQSSNSFTSLPAGSYSMIVKDANNCTTTTSVVTLSNLYPTPEGTISNKAICEGQPAAVAFTATQGTGPFDLVISGVTYTGVNSGDDVIITPAPATSTTYSLTRIADAHDCVNE